MRGILGVLAFIMIVCTALSLQKTEAGQEGFLATRGALLHERRFTQQTSIFGLQLISLPDSLLKPRETNGDNTVIYTIFSLTMQVIPVYDLNGVGGGQNHLLPAERNYSLFGKSSTPALLQPYTLKTLQNFGGIS